MGRKHLQVAYSVTTDHDCRGQYGNRHAGLLLAGIDEFLQPYTAGTATFTNQVDTLLAVVANNDQQVQRLNQAKATISEWQRTVCQPMIKLRSEIAGAKTMDDMADLIAEAKGLEYFNAFLKKLDQFKENKEGLLDGRQKMPLPLHLLR